MEQGYLIDTNVIIDNLGNKLPYKAKEFLNSFKPVLSAVTKIEVLGWLNATTEQLNLCMLYGNCNYFTRWLKCYRKNYPYKAGQKNSFRRCHYRCDGPGT